MRGNSDTPSSLFVFGKGPFYRADTHHRLERPTQVSHVASIGLSVQPQAVNAVEVLGELSQNGGAMRGQKEGNNREGLTVAAGTDERIQVDHRR